MKMILWSLLLLAAICMGSAFLSLRCIVCHNHFTNTDYAQLAKEIVERSVRKD